MDWQQVLTQLTDLPRTYLRTGSVFQQWMNSLTEELSRYTTATDALTAQVAFTNAVAAWLDVWGELFGIARNSNESDAAYSQRIMGTLQAEHGPPLAISAFMLLSLGLRTTVTENIPAAVGWSLQLGSSTTTPQEATIAQALDFVRPAGVPYNFNILRGGCFLTTVNYLGRAKVTGAYLTLPYSVVGPNIPANTNNSTPLLPTTFLTDPQINPSLA